MLLFKRKILFRFLSFSLSYYYYNALYFRKSNLKFFWRILNLHWVILVRIHTVISFVLDYRPIPWLPQDFLRGSNNLEQKILSPHCYCDTKNIHPLLFDEPGILMKYHCYIWIFQIFPDQMCIRHPSEIIPNHWHLLGPTTKGHTWVLHEGFPSSATIIDGSGFGFRKWMGWRRFFFIFVNIFGILVDGFLKSRTHRRRKRKISKSSNICLIISTKQPYSIRKNKNKNILADFSGCISNPI